MNDREIFRNNLNYYLSISGKKQKDLAEYVGAKTTTVSGWTRGISYPRADSMEKIAMFFGIKTSQLVGKRNDVDSESHDGPETDDVRLLIQNIKQFTPDEISQVKAMMKVMFAKTRPNLFEKGTEKGTDDENHT